MPEAGATIEFKNRFKTLKAPYVIYSDFECLTVPIDVKSKSTKTTTTSYQNHRPCGFMPSLEAVSPIDTEGKIVWISSLRK